jgi:cytochrome c oxidase subunit 2
LDKHIDVVLNGRAGTAMPAWGNMLTTAETAAVLTYTRNAFGNASKDVVQPQTIAQVKSGQTHGNQ